MGAEPKSDLKNSRNSDADNLLLSMSALPCPKALVDAGVGIVCSCSAGELALHALHASAERVTAGASLGLRTLQVATRRLVVGAATQLTQAPHGVLVLGLELKLGLAARHAHSIA